MLTAPLALADPDNPLSELDIDVCNVRPAYDASLAHGVEAAELEARFGWAPARMQQDGATVSGASTHAHLAWMATRPGFAAFVLDAVSRHGPASLGVVGLACKTSPTIGDALARHGRYQSLTNRTARYDAHVHEDALVLEEARFGPPSKGSALMSDYTMLVAVQLMRTLLGEPVAPLRIESRRRELADDEQRVWAAFAGVSITPGADRAALWWPATLLTRPVPSSDADLEAYFARVLQTAQPDPPQTWQARVRRALERRLCDGTPTAERIAKDLGLGRRTLARRLEAEGQTFATVLTDVRKALAVRHLADPSLSLAEVAFVLGFREQASFHRAFKRWFGTTPAAHRGG